MITKEQVLENLEECKKYIQEAENIKEEKVLGIAIKNRFTGDIIFQSTKTTYKEAVEEAIKSQADLCGAYLSNANLSQADLCGADLSGADLSQANLCGAYLSNANLSQANLSGADLSKAYLSWANLSGAYLSEANLSGADLSKANLSQANLSGADLCGAKLDGCLFYMGNGNRNFEALCKAIKTIRHNDGSFEEITASK